MPGARCTRGLVCKVAQKKAHTSIQVQRRQSGIPCAMVLRLMPCSPRRRILFVTVASGLRLVQARLGRRISAGLTSATDARTTRFCRTQQAPFVLRAVHRSRVLLALRSTLRADAAASTASHPAFVTTAKRPSCRERTGRAGRTDLPDSESGIFFAGGLEDPNQIEIAMINRLCERSQTEFRKVGKGEIAPCPPSRARRGLWARCRFAHPTQLVSGL
jgi:hypothetical protein